ncbi:hypothetical protein OBK27_13555 [Empedobacter falsenii]
MNNNEVLAQRVEIGTLEEFQSHLQNIKNGEVLIQSKALQTTLSLQLKVINLLNKSTLVDSTFDLIFADFKKALKQAIDEDEQELIREKVQLYIHNYIFFLDAKLAYQFKKDEENAEELLVEAASLLAENSGDLLLLVSGAGTVKVAASKLASELISKAKDNPNLIRKVINWYKKEERQKKAILNFNEALDLLYSKLEYHKTSIGQSDLIMHLLKRWKDDILNYRKHKIKFIWYSIVPGILITIALIYFSVKYIFNLDWMNFIEFSNSLKASIVVIFIFSLVVFSSIFNTIFNRREEENRFNKLIKFYSTYEK